MEFTNTMDKPLKGIAPLKHQLAEINISAPETVKF
jgi:hypothetical protein